MKNLIKEGFVFDGYKGRLGNTENMIYSYPAKPNIITVMYQFSQSRYNRINDTNIKGEFDYAHFNYKLLTVAKDECLPLKDLYVFSRLNDKPKEIIIEFNVCLMIMDIHMALMLFQVFYGVKANLHTRMIIKRVILSAGFLYGMVLLP